nr:zinc finger, CCHC-type [Tanacetum cinerariifolium]
MKEDDSIDEFTAKVNSIVIRASDLGSTNSSTKTPKSSVPKRFIQIMAAIEQFTDLEETTLDEVIGRLKAFEERVNIFNGCLSDNQDKLLFLNHDNSSSHEKGFKNGGQQKFRLGHLNFDSIKQMTQKKFVEGIPIINHKNQVRNECLLGKHSRALFPNQTNTKSLEPLNLVCGDLCGPISPETESGKKYMFLLVDDCTWYMWVYFLKSKDEAFETFKQFKLKVENEVRKKLKSFRTEKGGKFTSMEFTRYCKENGILRQLTAPYSPQQNGIVKR